MKPFTFVKTVILFCCLFLLRCSNLTSIAGATDMPNETASVSAVIHDHAGMPVYRAAVTMVRAEYLTPLPQTTGSGKRGIFLTMTDESGHFIVDSLDSGSYMIEVNDGSGSACRIHCAIGNDTGTKTLGAFTVQPYASVIGKIDIMGMPAAQRYVQIYGLNRIVPIESNGSFNIGGLPADLFTFRIVSTDTEVGPIDIGGIRLSPGETKNLYVPWAQSMKINLNTTLSGAGVSGNTYGFPILIRLNSNNFNFSSAQIDGRDIRFTKPDNTMLPYEIERWDPVAGCAEVWVKVDTVYGNDSTQAIIMIWGNPNASGNSNGGAVFDTSNGFQGVWHCNRKFDDVTYGGNNGTNYGTTDTTGIIGYCMKFDGSDSIKIAGLLGSPASITMSAWAQLDSVPGGGYGGEVLSIGDAILIRMDYSVLGLGTYGAIHPNGDSVYYNVSSGQFLKQTGWHFIAFSVDQNNHSQTLYIDGSAVRSENYMISIDYSRVGQNTFIGTHGNGRTGYNFSGMIDEVRVYRKSILADYVKLSFMNQRQDDRLVTVTSLSKVQ